MLDYNSKCVIGIWQHRSGVAATRHVRPAATPPTATALLLLQLQLMVLL